MPDQGSDQLASLRAQLAQARGALRRADQERIEYLQNVSHQLTAPLNAIKWHIENLTEGRVSSGERIKKVLRSVYSQATLAVHLAKNFALMSNLEADQELSALREPLQRVNLCQLLVNLADDFQPQGWDKGIQLGVRGETFDSQPQPLLIKPLVSQAFSNIIENALKYANPDSTIVIDGDSRGQDTVGVSIGNVGIPLRPEDETRIFERGYRTTEARNQHPAGTGFGLYIARRIVELHQGSISAATLPDGRVVFSVTLPISGLEGKAREREPKNSAARR